MNFLAECVGRKGNSSVLCLTRQI